MSKKTDKEEAAEAVEGWRKLADQNHREVQDLRTKLYKAEEEAKHEKTLRERANEHYRQVEQERDEAHQRLIQRSERSKMTDIELDVVARVALGVTKDGRVRTAWTPFGPMVDYGGEEGDVRDSLADLRRRAVESLDIELVARGVIAPRAKKADKP